MSEIRSTPALLYCILLVMILNTIWTALVAPPDTDSTKTAVRIECLLHADNPAVHDLCVKKGYDK